jgi:hypothetical protein
VVGTDYAVTETGDAGARARCVDFRNTGLYIPKNRLLWRGGRCYREALVVRRWREAPTWAGLSDRAVVVFRDSEVSVSSEGPTQALRARGGGRLEVAGARLGWAWSTLARASWITRWR